MTLYELNQELRSIIDTGKCFVSTETGEVFTPEALNALQIAREEKIEGCAVVIKEQLATAKALKEEADTLLARAKTLTNRAEWLKNYLQEQLNGETFESSKAKISYRHSKAVEILDEALIPKEYLKTSVTVAKAEIGAFLKQGGEVPGARLLEKTNMQIK